jgi:TonB family protein
MKIYRSFRVKKIFSAAMLLLVAHNVHADFYAGELSFKFRMDESAAEEFRSLVELGHAQAIYRLGQMANQGKGEEQDQVKALAHFQLASQLGEKNAAEEANTLVAILSKSQLKQAEVLLKTLQAQVLVPQTQTALAKDPIVNAVNRRVKHREQPSFQNDAVRSGIYGYTKHELTINAAGKVTAVKLLESSPAGLYDAESERVLRLWRYSPSPDEAVEKVKVQLSYNEPEPAPPKHPNKLLQLATEGDADAQYELANSLAEYRDYVPEIDDSLEMPKQLPQLFDTLLPIHIFNPKLEVTGPVIVTVNDQATIVAVDDPKQQVLIGLVLEDARITAGRYKIWSSHYTQVHPVIKVPAGLLPDYWYEQAARNGHKDAQRHLSKSVKEWRDYLAKKP